MSEDNQPSGNDPQNPRKPGEAPGSFNWRVLILFSVALGLLTLAYLNIGGGPRQSLSYSEFETLMRENKVVLDNPKMPLEIVTSESSFNAEIVGYSVSEPLVIKKDGAPREVRVRVNLDMNRDEVANLVGSTAQYVDAADLPVDSTGNDELTLSDLRALVRDNRLILDGPNKVRIAPLEKGGNAVIVASAFDVRPVTAEELVAMPKPKRFRVPVNTQVMSQELNALHHMGIPYRQDANLLRSLLVGFLPILILILLLFFLFRHQMKSAGRGAMNFGKSKARLLSMDRNKVTFKDVAGIQEAKEELWEIVEFLRDPRKFQKLGGSIPKGVLMVGAPGTGKTLLARAIAGEADVPFFSISGSDFVEMFVGVGASRVRDMFEQGKKQAPCLIFIDEIDAVGRHRGHGMGGGHDEREQTLNALLVEMDGFDTQEGVIIIAATNRPDVLDPALLRPGRFDRQVTVSLPDVKGREEILKVHVKKIKLAAGTNLGVIARGTPGFSGAELANLINEAALLAARKGLKAVSLPELEEARDKVRWGRERRSLALSEKEKENTAYHEAGHAILNVILKHTDPLHKVTIIPRGPSLGSTMFLPEEDRFTYRKNELLDQLIVAMGGRVAEEIVFGDVTNGAVGDIRMATNIARRMVCEWGMSEQLGMIEYGETRDEVFLARDMGQGKSYSEETAQKIDGEIKLFIDTAYQTAKQSLLEHRDKLDAIAKALLEYETLDGNHIRQIMETGEMQDPPQTPKPPEYHATPREKPKPRKDEGEEEDDDGPIGEVVGAPA
ncbi:MAG: ATP-dependent zinc metalloprotease FtsH [Verrucomicrobia bacterium]|nr:ATP-dependent zinc metalloprotease FtsH [Verrucomicrobiota bacterium]MDA1004966.1 ATP-dependent zinc metalloprotease FtsH [Verrucomicrobiota bacterium]